MPQPESSVQPLATPDAAASPAAPAAAWHSLLHWLVGWWRVIHLGAVLVVLALSPSSYARRWWPALARQIVRGTLPMVLWFTLLAAFVSVVLIRIVMVTAVSYGLSSYALEMVVRVLVLELIPLAAALFVTVHYSLPQGAELVGHRRRARLTPRAMLTRPQLLGELLPRFVAGAFAVVTLAWVSCVVALVLAYLATHGFTPWALAGYTRSVGQVFDPVVSLIFVLKTLFFSLTVALIPVASAVHDAPEGSSRTRVELRALVRMFTLLLLIELASLVGNYV